MKLKKKFGSKALRKEDIYVDGEEVEKKKKSEDELSEEDKEAEEEEEEKCEEEMSDDEEKPKKKDDDEDLDEEGGEEEDKKRKEDGEDVDETNETDAGQENAKDKLVGNVGSSPEKIKENLAALFKGHQLSADFKKKAAAVFEATVNTCIKSANVKLKEHYAKKLHELKKAHWKKLAEGMDRYTDHIATQWLKENKIAVLSESRVSVAEDLLEGLEKLLKERHVGVPASKVSMVEKLEARVRMLEGKLSSSLDKNVSLVEKLKVRTREDILSEASTGLSKVKAEKLAELVEGAEFVSSDKFKEKVALLKETLVEGKVKSAGEVAKLLREGKQPAVSERMNKYLASMSKI